MTRNVIRSLLDEYGLEKLSFYTIDCKRALTRSRFRTFPRSHIIRPWRNVRLTAKKDMYLDESCCGLPTQVRIYEIGPNATDRLMP